MKAIRFTLNNLDLVIDAFEPTGANGVIRMVQDAVGMALQLFDKRRHGRMAYLGSHKKTRDSHLFLY